jgi:hypothetical protein
MKRKTGLLLALVGALAISASLAHAEIAQKGSLRVVFAGELNPSSLPRAGAAPISVSIGGRISTTNGGLPPQLRSISLQINREGHLDYTGLPVCLSAQIQPSTSAGALAACRHSLVGEGTFSANVLLPEQSPFPSEGKVLAFNGRLHGRPVIFAHVFGTKPVPTSYTLPFAIKASKGTFGTTLSTSLPQTTGEWGFVTGLEMTLKRTFRYRGANHSYLSAGCPAPKGFPSALFPFARASFAFANKKTLTSTLERTCKVRG